MERKKKYITLPERDALLFESDPTDDFFKVVIPDAVHSYIFRLVTPELEKFAQQGWEVDDDKLYPLEPDIKAIVKWVPFTKVKFRCKGVTVHLRQVRTENRRYQSSGNKSGDLALCRAFHDAETIRDLVHDRIEKDSNQILSASQSNQTHAVLQQFAQNGLAGLCWSIGFPETKIKSILAFPLVKMWLQEILLKHMLFSLLLMGKGYEITTVRATLYTGFGEEYVDGITAEAMALYEEFARIFERAKQTGDTSLYTQLAAIIRQSITGSNIELEKYHQACAS